MVKPTMVTRALLILCVAPGGSAFPSSSRGAVLDAGDAQLDAGDAPLGLHWTDRVLDGSGATGVAQPAQTPSATLAEKPPPLKVIDLSMQKAGTSSFAEFCFRSLNVSALHASWYLMPRVGYPPDLDFSSLSFGKREKLCQRDSDADQRVNVSYPDYDQWRSVPDRELLADVLTAEGVACYADTPIPFWYDWIEQLLPHAKVRADAAAGLRPRPCCASLIHRALRARVQFIIWARPSDEWTESFMRYFCDSDHHENCSGNRLWLWTYGHCNPGNATRGDVQRAYEKHLADVTAYFSTPARSSKLMVLDFTDDSASRSLCEFIFPSYDLRREGCAKLSGPIPNVAPEALGWDMTSGAINKVEKAIAKVETPRANGT